MGTLVNLNSLWIGDALHPIHQMCLLSAMAQGHSVRLFSYGPVKQVPAGVDVVSAEEVMPRSQMFFHGRTGSPAPFADRFRIKLIELGFGAWTDTDMLFVRPLPAMSKNIFGWENDKLVGNAVMAFDPDHPAFHMLRDTLSDDHFIPSWFRLPGRMYYAAMKKFGAPRHVKDMPYGTTGPDLLTWCITQHGLLGEVAPKDVFYPLPYGQKFEIFKAHAQWRSLQDFPTSTVAIHLWFQGLLGGLQVNREASTKIPDVETGSLLHAVARDLGVRASMLAGT